MADNNTLLEKLEGLVARFEEVSTLITDPNVIADQKRYVKLTKEYKDMSDIMKARKEYIQCLNGLEEAKQIMTTESDPEMKEMAREEANACEVRIPELEEEIKLLLVPADPQDDRNAILEIRGGTGGDEAAIFAGDLFRMYSKYCETKGWKLEVSSANEGAAGGFKEIICYVTGDKVYGTLKYESGVHRVQRVPATETQGRVHTSAASVAVLPEAEPFDVEINEGEIKWDTFRSGGAGEIDKLGSDHRGDPSSAMLEVLDPEQNNTFHDNYLDVDYDLSKVMFIATANNLGTIPPPLLDRMELIEVSGYITEEKVEIARRHLVPKELEANGIKKGYVKFSKQALEYIIENYTRESGVRELEKKINKIMRKIALQFARDGFEKVHEIKPDDVREYLGTPEYTRDKYQGNDYAGVVTGLAWTAVGGEILFV